MCYHVCAQLSACYRFQCYMQCKCVIASTVYGCVITYELNCLRVTASSVTCSVSLLSLQLYIGESSLTMSSTVCVFYSFQCTCSVKCVIVSTVYWCVITYYDINCLRVTAVSVTVSVKCVTATVHWCVIVHGLHCLRVTAFSVRGNISMLPLQL